MEATTTYAYDPELAAVVAVLPQLDITDIPAARAGMLAMREQMPPFVKPDGITIEKRTVPGPAGDPDIEVATELHHYPGTFHGSSGAGAGTAISTRMVADRLAALARAYAAVR